MKKNYWEQLKNCLVKQIDYQYMLKFAYEVYKSAKEGYISDRDELMDKEIFNQNILKIKNQREFWGIFSISNELIGYCNVLIYDGWCELSTIKIDPAFRSNYPMYALIHILNEYYLNQRNASYISAGMRSISHETSFQ